MKPISARLLDHQINLVKTLGNGNLTKGLRVLIDYVQVGRLTKTIIKEAKKKNLGKV